MLLTTAALVDDAASTLLFEASAIPQALPNINFFACAEKFLV
jgi:hypothetical protein